jgi:TPP-dependent trihydroxycyclohexane-1,2-dione (THcHDO) dehydratase
MLTGDLYAATAANLDISPDVAGVYELYENGNLIYIGRALGGTVTIRSRLKDHKAGRSGACTMSFTAYKRHVTSDAANLEVQLLSGYRAAYGRLPRCNERVG